MPPKQKTKAELKQQVDKLTRKLRAAEESADNDLEAERDEARKRAEEAERQMPRPTAKARPDQARVRRSPQRSRPRGA